MISKELNGWTDEDTIAALYFDYRIQYSLGISDFNRERICINTLGNFRSRLYEYRKIHNCDLLDQEISRLTGVLIDLSSMDTRLARQDSMMISANCKKMGRLELIYTVNANIAFLLKDEYLDSIPETCKHYLQDKDKSNQIYRLTKDEVSARTAMLLKESMELYDKVPDELRYSQAFKNLSRLIEEQTNNDNTPKDGKELNAGSLQNPLEPDAHIARKAVNLMLIML